MIVGSTAAKKLLPDFREPTDLDVISPVHVPNADVIWHESFPAEWADAEADLDFLYTLKASHAFWDLHGTWDKHMTDMLTFARAGAKFNREQYDILFPVWKQKHGRKRTNLNMTKSDFFNDAVQRKYDHDSLHDSVAYGEEPMYTRILKDGSDVLVDNSKFWAMSEEDRFKTIREEVYATALERWVIPTDYAIGMRAAYHRAMKKAITSLFKGEWALYIVLNYETLRLPDMDYVKHHKSKSHKLVAL